MPIYNSQAAAVAELEQELDETTGDIDALVAQKVQDALNGGANNFEIVNSIINPT